MVASNLGAAKEVMAAQTQRVEDLKKQLAQAQSVLDQNTNTVNGLQQNQDSLDATIANLNRNIGALQGQAQQCKTDLVATQNSITRLSDSVIPGLNAQKAALEEQLKNLNNNLVSINSELNNDIPANIASLNARLPKLNADLSYLVGQVPLFQTALSRAYTAANDADQNVLTAQQNLDSASRQYTNQTNIVKTATSNLEIARIEKENADNAVNTLLQISANVVPFATSPVSSAPAPISSDGTMAINSWPVFVQKNFGSSINPFYQGDVSTLYSFGSSSGNCGAPNQSSMSGFVIQVGESSFRLLVNSRVFTVEMAACTQGLSNMQNYKMAPGDIACVKGSVQSSNSVVASTVATIRH